MIRASAYEKKVKGPAPGHRGQPNVRGGELQQTQAGHVDQRSGQGDPCTISMRSRHTAIRRLGENHRRPPWHSHAAVALLDSRYHTERLAHMGLLITGATPRGLPAVRHELLAELFEDFGQEEVLDTASNGSQLRRSRGECCYGTQGSVPAQRVHERAGGAALVT